MPVTFDDPAIGDEMEEALESVSYAKLRKE
jgi:hypothetical protein